MKLTNNQMQSSLSSLYEISKKQLKVKTSYAIAKNINHINSELKIYNNEREKLIEKYSIKDENGETIIDDKKTIKLQPELMPEWNKDMTELLSIENEVDIGQFSIESLEGINMSASDIMAIEFMIKE